MYTNWHLVAQQVQDRHDEIIHEVRQARAATVVAEPSLRARVARALARRGHQSAPGPVGTTLRARPASGAGD